MSYLPLKKKSTFFVVVLVKSSEAPQEMRTAAVGLSPSLHPSAPEVFSGACQPFLLHLFSIQNMFMSTSWRVYATSEGTEGLQWEGQEDELPSDACASGGVASSRGKVWFHSILKPVSLVNPYLTCVETKYRKLWLFRTLVLQCFQWIIKLKYVYK